MVRILALGTSHAVAPARFRDGMYMDEPAVREFLSDLMSADLFEEAVLLHTCTRSETYAVVRDTEAAEEELVQRLAGRPFAAPMEARAAEIREHSYGLSGLEAGRHLLRVAAGLDSIILGEAQILGQVKEAVAVASSVGATGPVLSHLFRGAIRAGKRARSETQLGTGPTSLASAGVRLAVSASESFPEQTVLVVGAGETASLTARHVAKRRPARLLIVNRTLERAQALAGELGGEAHPLESLVDLAAEAAVIISATSAQEPVLSGGDLTAVMERRPRQPLVCVDLGRPRNVERLAGPIANLTIHDLDGLAERVELNRERQAGEIPKAESIVDEELERFAAWRRERRVVPVLTALRDRFFETGAREVEAQVKRMGPERRDELERYTQALLAKLLHVPTTRIKEVDRETDRGAALLDSLRELFELADETGVSDQVPNASADASDDARDAQGTRVSAAVPRQHPE
ncbi:MAG: glutamyl-tRNA reductase [Gemmatimonadota bacterium]